MASSDSDTSYEVDQILKQRKRKGLVEYLVRWQGFGENEDSWEAAKSLKNCKDAMAQFIKLSAPVKSSKKSRSRSQSRSRSRSRSRKTKSSPSRTPRPRTPKAQTSRSRSRSSSRGRTAKVESPSRQSRRSEVVTKTSIIKEEGKVEKTRQSLRHTIGDSKEIETTKTVLVQTSTDVKNMGGDAISQKKSLRNSMSTFWQTADVAILVIFVCISIITLSYVVENYMSPSDISNFFFKIYTAISGTIIGFWKMMGNSANKAWETTANFMRNSWKTVTTN